MYLSYLRRYIKSYLDLEEIKMIRLFNKNSHWMADKGVTYVMVFFSLVYPSLPLPYRLLNFLKFNM